jgi:formate hydrogenlyase subunit 6/NADH:ubiquinone oxidoreductase subunit I
MAFTKTDTDFTDFVLEARDTAWLAKGVGSPRHLMLDPDHCILCRECEDVCPWNCISLTPSEFPGGSAGEAARSEVNDSHAVFVVDDGTCTRCSVCVDRCPTDTLYYARLPEGAAEARTLASVSLSQRAEPE